MATIAGVTVTFALPENDTRRQNSSLGQAQDLSWKYLKYNVSDRIIRIPLNGLTTTVKDALITALESNKAGTTSLVAGGTNYGVNNVLTLSGGTSSIYALVLTLGGSNAVATYSVFSKGSGITTGTKTTTVAPGIGANCTISVDTVTDQLTINPDSHVDLGSGAGEPITVQWIDQSFEFTKTNHDSWSGVLTFIKVA